MKNIESIDWELVTYQMNEKGFSVIPEFLSENQCDHLKTEYHNPNAYRKTVVMERYRFGLGEYKYFNYPLPDIILQIRTEIYSKLAPIANGWFKALQIDRNFPPSHLELLQHCHANNQQKATVLILKYGKGGHNTLHQDLYGEIYFPIQVVLFLSDPDHDYTGGEFVFNPADPKGTIQSHCIETKER